MTKRYAELDALRGVAATVVLLQHCLATLPAWEHATMNPLHPAFWANPLSVVKATPLRLLVAGPAAVLVFFALSGFVLTLALTSQRRPSYPIYVGRRFCRIWLPFAVAILGASGLCALLGTAAPVGVSAWFTHTFWTAAPTVQIVAGHLAMIGTPIFQQLDQPMWSLVHELRVSIAFPLLLAAMTWRPIGTLAATMALSLACAIAPVANPYAQSFFSTVGYLSLFAAGIGLALHRERVRTIIGKLSTGQRIGCWSVALLLLMSPMNSRFGWVVASPGAALLVLMCFADPAAQGFLLHRIPKWLGRVSYSLYLTHIIVLMSLVRLLGGMLPLVAILPIAFGSALLVAELFHRAVEAPTTRLGQRLGRASGSRSMATA